MFPTTFIDNVFENPDAVRDFALKQDYTLDNINKNYPGKRSQPLSIICPRLDAQICSTILNQYYDLKNQQVSAYWDSYFQITPRENSDSGLVHRDSNVLLSAVLFLNKNDFDWGTSVYEPSTVDMLDHLDQDKINGGFETRNDSEWESYVEKKRQNYREILRVDNVYNNMIVFNGYKAHKANLHNPNASEDRLTIVTFISSIIAPEYPYARSKMHNSFV